MLLENSGELYEMLHDILGTNAIYYNPPSDVQMEFPAIRYERSKINNKHADNSVYIQRVSYDVVVITDDPDSDIADQVSRLPMCSHVDTYEAEGLYHDKFTITI